MIAAFLLLLVQAPAGEAWRAAPARPTVGDTIRLERVVAAPPGWRVRAQPLAPGSELEPLGDPVILSVPGATSWLVRYPVTAWVPGTLTVTMPPLWRLGPEGTADSLAGGVATVTVASVIPDSVESPRPQPALGPLRSGSRRAWP
ncbi:MAG: hypothetical protein ACREMN_04695, partial [Gemmatimonadales bacterium]